MNSIAGLGIGTYVLVLRLRQPATIPIGKLGTFSLSAGFYTYVGSAMGSGGLEARLGHHLKVSPCPHWHIDYLRQVAVIQEIWFLESPARREHDWAALLNNLPGAAVVIPRFGASDCHCITHLYGFQNPPDFSQFQKQNARRFPSDGHLSINRVTD